MILYYFVTNTTIYDSRFSELDQYCEAYHQLKGMRTLEWKLNLGQVQVKIAVALHCLTDTDKIDHPG